MAKIASILIFRNIFLVSMENELIVKAKKMKRSLACFFLYNSH